MVTKCDIQVQQPDIEVELDEVGVREVKKILNININSKLNKILATFNIYVNLPKDQKGIHMSRHIESVEELIISSAYSVEMVCLDLINKLKTKHEYATKIKVEMFADYMVTDHTPVTKKETQEMHKIICGCEYNKITNKTHIIIGVEVVGITACPCAQNLLKEKAIENLEKEGFSNEQINKILNSVTIATHNQRGITKIILKIPSSNVTIYFEDLINIAKLSMSSSIYSVLKRPDEAYVVESAHNNTNFVEDCIRNAYENINNLNLIPGTEVFIEQINKESIHRHDAYANIKYIIK